MLLAGSAAFGQSPYLQALDPLSSTPNGLRLYGVSVSAQYFTGSVPSGNGTNGIPFFYGYGGDQTLTGVVSATLGWSRTIGKARISVTYSPAYVRGFYFQDFSAYNHSFSISVTPSLGSLGSGKWRLSSGASGYCGDYRELLFAPTPYGNVTGTAATFDEFAAAVLTGTTTNPALATLISTPGTAGAESAYLFGARMCSLSAQIGAAYQQSQRSTFSVSVSGTRMQSLPSSGDSNGHYVSNATSASATLGWSYMLSPRTTFGVSVSAGRTFSPYLDSYNSQGTASIGRTMSRRWFLQGSVGVGHIMPTRQVVSIARNTSYVFSGSIGFKTQTQTFLGSYSRSLADMYGAGAEATESSSGSWRWRKPGQPMTLYATVGYMRLVGPGLPVTGGLQEAGGVTRSLGRQFALSASYTHISLPAALARVNSNLSAQGVMLTLSWSPLARRQ